MPKPKNGSSPQAIKKGKTLSLPQGWKNATVSSPPVSSPLVASIRRSTERISVSLLAAERAALEERAARLRGAGHRDIKTSRLARIAFKLLQQLSDEEILSAAQEVENLEVRRAQKRG